ncbi:MAG: glycoside hydrolase family 3 N-terminal domain-containing protein [Kiritimatiellae bacterium]|nr:glycoside hydrolase family 3 N-terminal domain-containing protein [Kiritimatiellia bacterium]
MKIQLSLEEKAAQVLNSFRFGKTEISDYCIRKVRAYRENGLISTAKHFPGQGDSRMNSHYELERIKIIRLKERYGLFKPLRTPSFSRREHRELAETIARKAVKITRNTAGHLPLSCAPEKPVLLIAPERNAKLDIGVHMSEKKAKPYIENHCRRVVEKTIPLTIGAELGGELKRMAENHSAVIFDASFRLPSGQSAILTEEQIDLLKHLQKTNGRVVVLALNPFIISQIPFVNAVVATNGRNEFVLRAAAEKIFCGEK